MYQVLARKTRPRNFDELVDQKHVTRTLTNAIRDDRVAHAYLFAGLRGTGKTTVARILAKCLNCENGPTVTPCDECAPCQEIAASRAMDVFEIDAASRTKVEQTRELLEMIAYPPVRDRYKVVIIDEVHMLSAASFNALLKTLEEPPPHVVFILATTEVQKILATILSRCQVFEFRRVGTAELREHLARIAEAEGIAAPPAALERIARAGEGSVRDALTVLERVVAFCGNEIAEDDVLRLLGGVRFEVVASLVRSLAARDAAGMLAVLDGLVDEGHDLLHFWGELIGALRDLLLLRAVPDRPDVLDRSAEESAALSEAAGELSDDDVTRAFQILAELEPGLKTSSRPRFLFESALIRLSRLGAVRPIEEVLEALRSPGGAGPTVRPTSARAERPSSDTPARPEKKKPGPALAPVAADDLRAHLIAAVAARPMVAGILEQAEAIEPRGNELLIRMPRGMEAVGRQLERPETAELLAARAAERLDRAVRIRVEAPGASEPPAAATSPAGHRPPRPPRAEAPAPPVSRRRPASAGSTAAGPHGSLIEKATAEPGVRKLLREFGAQVIDIRPLDPADGALGADDADTVEDGP